MQAPRYLVGLLLLAAVACQEQPVLQQLPTELLGVWETTEPRYSDRFFEFREDRTIRFGQGQDGVDVSPVTSVLIDHDGSSLLYSIEHLNDAGDPYTFTLRFDPARGDELRFVHQPFVVWTKRSPRTPTRPR